MFVYRARGIQLADGIRLLIRDLDIRRLASIIRMGLEESQWYSVHGRGRTKNWILGDIFRLWAVGFEGGKGP